MSEQNELQAVEEQPAIPEKSLTKSEERLLAELRKPTAIGLPVTQICERAEVDEATYYRAFKKEHFLRKVHDECVTVVHSSLLPILNTAAKLAQQGTLPASHHWAKILLEMSGLYVPNKAAQVKSEIKIMINVPRPGGEGQVIDVSAERVS